MINLFLYTFSTRVPLLRTRTRPDILLKLLNFPLRRRADDDTSTAVHAVLNFSTRTAVPRGTLVYTAVHTRVVPIS